MNLCSERHIYGHTSLNFEHIETKVYPAMTEVVSLRKTFTWDQKCAPLKEFLSFCFDRRHLPKQKLINSPKPSKNPELGTHEWGLRPNTNSPISNPRVPEIF